MTWSLLKWILISKEETVEKKDDKENGFNTYWNSRSYEIYLEIHYTGHYLQIVLIRTASYHQQAKASRPPPKNEEYCVHVGL